MGWACGLHFRDEGEAEQVSPHDTGLGRSEPPRLRSGRCLGRRVDWVSLNEDPFTGAKQEAAQRGVLTERGPSSRRQRCCSRARPTLPGRAKDGRRSVARATP